MERNFLEWLQTFRESIADYSFYVDFEKVYRNIEKIKIELNILNSLIGSKNIECDFKHILKKYPEVLKCVPILLAIRKNEIYALDEEGEFKFNFKNKNYSDEEYIKFMRKSGLFELIEDKRIKSLEDYITGVEVGLDSNGRKNRGGHLMENLIEKFIKKAGFKKDETYFKEIYINEIEKRWNIDLSNISNQGGTEKRFDFVVKTKNNIYLIETNFYSSGGSKLNETARSYKTISKEVEGINNLKFIWFTDGLGWKSARNNLKETFDVLENIYNIKDIENGIMQKIFI